MSPPHPTSLRSATFPSKGKARKRIRDDVGIVPYGDADNVDVVGDGFPVPPKKRYVGIFGTGNPSPTNPVGVGNNYAL